ARLDLLLVARAGSDGGARRRLEVRRGGDTSLEHGTLAPGAARHRGAGADLASAGHSGVPAEPMGHGADGLRVLLGHAGALGGLDRGLASRRRPRRCPRRAAATSGAGRGVILAEHLLAARGTPLPDPLHIGADIGGVPVLIAVAPLALVQHLEAIEASSGD